MKLLIVEDQRDIARNLADFFSRDDWQLDFADNGIRAVELALSQYYDVVVLDLMLPGLDGISVCRQIRERASRHVPIIMLTARDATEDKITGFESGADDYLTKPFVMQELRYRCLALSHRHRVSQQHSLELGELVVDRQTRAVVRAGESIQLNQIAFDILLYLAEAYPRVVSRSELVERIWGAEGTDSDALRSHVYQLRQQLDKPFAYNMLRTVHGVGFVLQTEPPA